MNRGLAVHMTNKKQGSWFDCRSNLYIDILVLELSMIIYVDSFKSFDGYFYNGISQDLKVQINPFEI